MGFDFTQAWQEEGAEAPQLSAEELEILKGLASGTTLAGHRGRRGNPTEDVEELLDKLGVESETEAIAYAIKAGVTWQ